MADTSMLYTTVKNLMGVDHVFGYLPPHGKKVLANAAFTVPGNLIERVLGNRCLGNYNRRGWKSLERDLLQGRLAIEKTPAPIFFDGSAPAGLANPVSAPTFGTVGGTTWTGTTGAYFFVYTYLNAYGETSIGASRSTAQTLTNGVTKEQINIPTLSGATSANVYASTVSGSEVFLQSVPSANFGALHDIPADFPTQAAPPGSNTATLPAPAIQPAVNFNGGGATGGSLAPGNYFAKYTWTNANGETTPSPESTQFTVSTGNIPSIVLQPAPNGVTGVNIYLTAAGGATNTEVLYDSLPIPAGGLASNLAGYLQPGTATTPETPPSLYLFKKAAPTSSTNPPGANTATVSAPGFTPVVSVSQFGVPSSSSLLSNLAPYLAPGMQGDVIYGAYQYNGALQAGTYYGKITYTTAAGETTASPEFGPFTVVVDQIPLLQVTPPSRSPEGQSLLPPGVTGVNIYLTAAGGASGTETLYSSGATAAIVPLSAATGNKPWPTGNTTAGHTIRSMRVNNDTLGTVDPSWGTYQGPA